MDEPKADFVHPRVEIVVETPRHLVMRDTLRYSKRANQSDPRVDGFVNCHWMLSPAPLGLPRVMLEAGINATAEVEGPDAVRRPVIAIRSSPWKAGQEGTPWHDEFDLVHGHIRYFGDHKPGAPGLPGATKGNRILLEAARLHSGTTVDERLLAPPLLVFRGITVHRDGQAVHKGHVEFCGAAIIEKTEYVVQRDPLTGLSFPNVRFDLAVVTDAETDGIDLRWIDDRRNPRLSALESLRFAPPSWARWTREGHRAVPAVRREALATTVRETQDQQPHPCSPEADILGRISSFYDSREEAFASLASQVASEALRQSGARYTEGWLCQFPGDSGVSFTGRLDIGPEGASTPLIVLGRAGGVHPGSSISPDQLARVAARLRPGWIGVFVTAGTFSRQAHAEMIDGQYPMVLISGRTLASTVRRIAEADHGGVLDELLQSTAREDRTS
ncbi:hypothetical protein GCM10009721_11800 [Terrabacter tumescens]|uniref:Restriction endonuclease AspBHI N-terminal domain-containing protein n=1 Tax=Terrabacter tumescens TaxID=60443 RepID=A0ABQ2HT97_9MICO|nr:hypothetical protein [Terrabacter tumescens]GGM88391.1 hypothetical protein GCM10009721_11800 [Terrabacter tumescens]